MVRGHYPRNDSAATRALSRGRKRREVRALAQDTTRGGRSAGRERVAVAGRHLPTALRGGRWPGYCSHATSPAILGAQAAPAIPRLTELLADSWEPLTWRASRTWCSQQAARGCGQPHVVPATSNIPQPHVVPAARGAARGATHFEHSSRTWCQPQPHVVPATSNIPSRTWCQPLRTFPAASRTWWQPHVVPPTSNIPAARGASPTLWVPSTLALLFRKF